LPLTEALALVEAAEQRLWLPEGAEALAYLRGRGLTDTTIRRAHLGWVAKVMLPTADGARFWRATGIVIPWWDRDRLVLVKIRQPEGRVPKYVEAFRDRPRIYPGPEAIRPGKPLIVCEGEFDALLLGQELGELASVITLGSASARPGPDILGLMLAAPVWYLATDADGAGDKAAAGWPARARRVRPPAPHKDWGEATQAGIDVRRWWIEEAFPLDGPFAIEERAAIQEHDGGLAPDGPGRQASSSSVPSPPPADWPPPPEVSAARSGPDARRPEAHRADALRTEETPAGPSSLGFLGAQEDGSSHGTPSHRPPGPPGGRDTPCPWVTPERLAVAARGDSLRAQGLALNLCVLPEVQPRVALPPLPGCRDDGVL
jgi:hypothetical protein